MIRRAAVGVATATIASVAAAAGVVYMGGAADTTALPGLTVAGPLTTFGLPAARVLSDVAGAVTLGLLLAAVCLTPVQREPQGRRLTVSVAGYRALRAAVLAAAAWLVAVVVQAILTVSDLLGAPAADVVRGPATASFLLDLVQGRALLVSATAAVVAAAGARLVLDVRWVVPLPAVALAGLSAPAFAGHAAASGNHQLAGRAGRHLSGPRAGDTVSRCGVRRFGDDGP
ncbi:hypothetical protein ABZS66_12085 [Dactylosporangium sp. NPDC005572]|uniref:hypothetical protein n=1 Tax=Dactylosporangium sp. NPDC005572 TaxID=3156889 RepID=UPI0033B5A00A